MFSHLPSCVVLRSNGHSSNTQTIFREDWDCLAAFADLNNRSDLVLPPFEYFMTLVRDFRLCELENHFTGLVTCLGIVSDSEPLDSSQLWHHETLLYISLGGFPEMFLVLHVADAGLPGFRFNQEAEERVKTFSASLGVVFVGSEFRWDFPSVPDPSPRPLCHLRAETFAF
jgi:hypothetical protein